MQLNKKLFFFISLFFFLFFFNLKKNTKSTGRRNEGCDVGRRWWTGEEGKKVMG
jgi:hypothetical protein